MKKTFRIVVLVLLTSIFVVVLTKNRKTVQFEVESAKAKIDSIPVHVAVPRVQPAGFVLETVGKVKFADEVFVISQTPGEIKEVRVKLGDHVKGGDVIARIDDYYALQEFSMARLAYEQLQKDFNRYSDLAKVQAVTQQQLEQLRLQMEGAQTKMASLERRLNDFIVKAPLEGIVNQVFVSRGNTTGPGTPVCEIVGGSSPRIEAKINPAQAVNLTIGAMATVTTEFGHGVKYNAHLAELGKKAGKFGGISAVFYLDQPGEYTPESGSMVNIQVKMESAPKLLLPAKAVTLYDGKTGLFLVKEDMTVAFTEVSYSDFDDASVAVQDSFLRNRKVVTDGNYLLKNGDRVRIIPE